MVLAIDAGFRCLGWALLDAGEVIGFGVIETRAGNTKRGVRVADDDARRCAEQARELVEVIRDARDRGGLLCAVVELPSGGAQSARAARSLGMATAIVASTLDLMSVPTEWTTPGEGKLAATGKRGGSKAEVIEGAIAQTGWRPSGNKARQEAVADAIAAYLAARNSSLVLLCDQQD